MSPLSEFPYLANEIINIYGVVGRINKLMDLGEYLVESRNSVNVTIFILCKYLAQNKCLIHGNNYSHF